MNPFPLPSLRWPLVRVPLWIYNYCFITRLPALRMLKSARARARARAPPSPLSFRQSIKLPVSSFAFHFCFPVRSVSPFHSIPSMATWYAPAKDQGPLNGLALAGPAIRTSAQAWTTRTARKCAVPCWLVEVVNAQGLTCTPSPRAAVCPFPTRPVEPAIDTAALLSLWDAARHAVEQLLERPVKLEIEPGRYLMAESGVLVTGGTRHEATGRQPFCDGGRQLQ